MSGETTPETPGPGGEPARPGGDVARPGGEPFVGPRDWPPAEMRWPPPPLGEPPGVKGGEEAGSAPRRAPPWDVLAAVLVAAPAIAVLQAMALRAFAAWHGLSSMSGVELSAALAEKPGGTTAMLLPLQLGLAAAALGLAALGRAPLQARLGLGRPRAGLARALALALGTAAVYVAARSAALGLFAEASERVELVDRLMRGLSWPYGLLLFALVPGVCEELFFRGLVQRGLLRALAPAQAIAATALLFGLFHGDLQQGTFAALLGAWLGWVAWRTDSVWSAAAGHVLANGIGLGLAHAVRGEMSP